MLKRHKYLTIIAGIIAVVMVWRGTWGLLDKFLYPQHSELSFAISLIIGLIILYLLKFKTKD